MTSPPGSCTSSLPARWPRQHHSRGGYSTGKRTRMLPDEKHMLWNSRCRVHAPRAWAVTILSFVILLWPTSVTFAVPGLDSHWHTLSDSHAAENGPVFSAQYYTPSPPRILRPRRPLPPRLRGYRPPRPKAGRGRGKRAGGNGGSGVRLSPSQALKRALRRWPDAIGLSVRLLRRDRPVYVVRVRSGSRVEQVLVDAVTGKVLR